MSKRTAEHFSLTKGEIQKIERLANKFSGRTDCKLKDYSVSFFNNDYADVYADICYNSGINASFNIILIARIDDARRSWARVLGDAEYIAPEL